MKLAAIAKLIKADGYCKLYKVFYDDCRTYDLYIGTKTAIFPLTGFPKAQNESELATLLGISKKEWADIEFDNDCPDDLHPGTFWIMTSMVHRKQKSDWKRALPT